MKSLSGAASAALLSMLLSVGAGASQDAPVPIRHVLLVSVDGLHALDLRTFTQSHPASTLAALARRGIEYTEAHTVSPADSFPGLLALVTGGTPAATGVYYDVTYDRRLSPPGSDCRRFGTAVVYDESVDRPGTAAGEPVLDAARLPLDPQGCKPVYPHSYLRVNTVFEAIRQAGGYTAWIDKHPVYEIVNGPSGRGVADLYTPEIGADFNAHADRNTDKITASITRTERYDASKVRALISEIMGFRHDGATPAPVPTIFGLNLQTINVAEKLAGYEDAQGHPSPRLTAALSYTDDMLGNIVDALRQHNLLDSTLVIVTAKHGNGPIDPRAIRRVDKGSLTRVVNEAAPGALAQMTTDQGALIWLRDQARTATVARALERERARLGIDHVLYGTPLTLYFPSPRTDPRTPDLVVIPKLGVIYTKAGDRKKAEHGGFLADDTNVALVVSNPHLSHAGVTINAPVFTTQVAPTILETLGISPLELQAVATQGTPLLPGESWGAFAARK